MKKLAASFLAVAVIATMSVRVRAEDAAPAEDPFFGLSVGLKGSFGGNYLTDPESAPNWALVYEDGAGGIGGGGGLYAELRVLEGHLGLEFDILFESNKNWTSIEFSNIVDTDWITRFRTMRLPLLLEGSLEGETTRVSLGVGPEFVVGLDASTDIEVTDGAQYVEAGVMDAQRANFVARKQTDTFLCVGLGLAFKVWKLAISLDLRYAYNLTQTKDYMERMNYSADYQVVDVVASSSMDMRLLLGIAYELGFDY
jgi:hypothetical protein